MSQPVPTFTLDTNCIIAIEERRPEGEAIRELVTAHSSGTANVAVVAISASERQRTKAIENFTQFQERLAALGLGHLTILPAMLYWDISFFDYSVFADKHMEELEKHIHKVLFPNIEFLWTDFCLSRNLPLTAPSNGSTWRNAKCDVQALWAHIHNGHDVFVTSDLGFHATSKRDALKALGANNIVYPADAVTFLISGDVR